MAKNKPNVFVGSSAENLTLAYAIQDNLEMDANITVWNQGVFGMSDYVLNSLEKELSKCDFGVFVMHPDDITRMRDISYETVRDNVILELGLFCGALGRSRTFLVIPRELSKLHLPSDLSGLICGTYDASRDDNISAALGSVCNKIRQRMNDLGVRQEQIKTAISASDFLFSLDDPSLESFSTLTASSNSIDLISRSAVNLFSMYQKDIERLCNSECRFRVLLVDPESEAASYIYGNDPKLYKTNIGLTIRKIRMINARITTKIDVRFTRFAPTMGIMLINSSNGGVARIQLYFLHACIGRDRPLFKVTSSDIWYNVFRDEFDQLWNNGRDLSEDDLTQLSLADN